MFARISRPLSRTTSRFTSTTTSRVALSSHSIDNRPEVDKVTKSARRVSTSPLPNDTNVPGNPEPPLGASGSFLNVKIPPPEVLSEPPIQVPYVPDFWDSAKLTPDASLTAVPKVVVVGGTETSHGSARPQSLEDINVPLESDSTHVPQQADRSDSFLDDIAEELHLPPIQEIKSSIRNIFS